MRSRIIDYQKTINALNSLSLNRLGAATDMLWISFGELKLVPDRGGKLKEVGEWALHLQCPWRFIQNHKVVLASSDFYYDAETRESLGRDFDRPSLFHKNAEQLNEWIEFTKLKVSSITHNDAGAFDLLFNSDLKLTVMPSQSDSITQEAWRLFKPTLNEPHIVFPQSRP